MLRASSSVLGSEAAVAPGLAGGAGIFGIAKCADMLKVAMSSVERTRVKCELRWSKE